MQFSFKDIINADSWQTIQNHFSEVLRIDLHTFDNQGNPLTSPSIVAQSYKEIIESTPQAVSYSRRCFSEALEASQSHWKEGYRSSLGLHTFFIPLQVKEAKIAYLKAGPVVLGKYNNDQQVQETVKNLGVDPETFIDALSQIKTFTFYGIKLIVELLFDISSCICELNYQNNYLKNLIPGVSSVLKEQSFSVLERVQDFYIEKLLNALLEVCCKFTEADRGSIMLVDKDKEELYVKMAKGVKEEIVRNARVKIVEGLSGIVVQDKKPLVIDDKTNDKRILKHCNNPELKHSILMPLKGQNDVFGVLTLGVYRDEGNKFNFQNLETIDKLTELVESTISAFSQNPA